VAAENVKQHEIKKLRVIFHQCLKRELLVKGFGTSDWLKVCTDRNNN